MAVDAKQRAIGERLYREGIRPNGEMLTAMGAAQALRTGKDAACAACHRRSGYGASEGQFVIRPITGPALLQEQAIPVRSPRVKATLGTLQRPAYNAELLARAIRKGIDVSNKPLNPVMPRYALNDDEMKALTAYLFTLSAAPSPGVDEQDMHFATVIQPGVSMEKRRAMLDVMEAFFKDKGSNVRLQEQRRDAGNMRMDRAYRKWILHVWELNGSSDTWGAQLEEFYKKQPVFALVGGLGTSSWGPIQAFSERFEIPCVFPQVDLPMLEGNNNYTYYFSRGLTLEAEVLAKFLRDRGESGKIVQVFRRDEAGSVAAMAFRAAIQSAPGIELEDHLLAAGQSGESLQKAVYERKPAAVVLWLGENDLKSAFPVGEVASPPIYLSFSLRGAKRSEVLPKEGANLRLIYPSDLPPKREARLLRNKHWLHNKGIKLTDETVQVNTLFAVTVVSDVVGHMLDSFSRDFFVERIEHTVGQTPMPSIFPQVSLGPGQHFAAKGSSIVQIGADDKSIKAISPWIVP